MTRRRAALEPLSEQTGEVRSEQQQRGRAPVSPLSIEADIASTDLQRGALPMWGLITSWTRVVSEGVSAYAMPAFSIS